MISIETSAIPIPFRDELPDDELPDDGPLQIPGVDKWVDASEFDALVRNLPEEDYLIVVHRLIREESLRDCGERVGKSGQTVANREKRIKWKLKNAIEAVAR